jgi:hypothetical protein
VRAYRELIVAIQGLSESVSGAIPYDDTIRQKKGDGTPFVRAVADTGGSSPAPRSILAQMICRVIPDRERPKSFDPGLCAGALDRQIDECRRQGIVAF